MGAPSRRARRIRNAAEFDIARLMAPLATPRGTTAIALTSWTLQQIFDARDAQMRGYFYLPARMAEQMRTDDALAPALENRLAPQRCIPVELVPAKGDSGKIAKEADAQFGRKGLALSDDTVASIHAYLANHDVAFATCTPCPRPDGSRVDYTVNAWPIEHVRWDRVARCYKTRIDPTTAEPGEMTAGAEVPIVHGDGRWVIFQRYEVDPFKHAAILSAAPVWARHAYAIRDWAKSSVAHGNVKMMGEMPTGSALQETDADGNTVNTAEAEAFVALMRDMVSSDSPVGIRPAGSKTEFVTNMSQAWQVFAELVNNGESAAARIYLGTDAIMGAKGGAPGVDIQALFGVASTKVHGDLECITRGIQTGIIEPWTAMNFGDSSLAPTRRYMLPDAEALALETSLAARTTAFYAALKGLRDAGLVITQEHVTGLAADFKVRAPIVQIAPTAPANVG